MSISSNIQEIVNRVEAELNATSDAEGGPSSETAATLHVLSIGAIHGGNASVEWRDYMSLFAKTPEELARLIPTDGTEGDASMREARAYLVRNGVCGPGTIMTLPTTVTTKLDL
ncbi:MAG TPA: hypothetical protein VFX96_01730 [Pyrinomonadaceae bacterium]|nr:hypothetical protein [Pyrinomonadaceae bacterium]